MGYTGKKIEFCKENFHLCISGGAQEYEPKQLFLFFPLH